MFLDASAADRNHSTAWDNLWQQNPALVHMLGLCPLLAVSTTVVNALALGLATLAVLISSNLMVSLIRNLTPAAIQLPVFVMIIGAFTSCVEFLMSAFAYDLYRVLGLFAPLIATNGIVLHRANNIVHQSSPMNAVIDGLTTGIGFLAVLLVLAALRELIGTGGLFANMQLLFGDIAQHWHLQFLGMTHGFLIAILPPGAFLLFGLLLAGRNLIDAHLDARRPKPDQPPPPVGNHRVRTTGKIT